MFTVSSRLHHKQEVLTELLALATAETVLTPPGVPSVLELRLLAACRGGRAAVGGAPASQPGGRRRGRGRRCRRAGLVSLVRGGALSHGVQAGAAWGGSRTKTGSTVLTGQNTCSL